MGFFPQGRSPNFITVSNASFYTQRESHSRRQENPRRLFVFQAYGCGSKFNHQEMDRRFWSLVPFTRLLFWVPIFDPQPYQFIPETYPFPFGGAIFVDLQVGAAVMGTAVQEGAPEMEQPVVSEEFEVLP